MLQEESPTKARLVKICSPGKRKALFSPCCEPPTKARAALAAPGEEGEGDCSPLPCSHPAGGAASPRSSSFVGSTVGDELYATASGGLGLAADSELALGERCDSAPLGYEANGAGAPLPRLELGEGEEVPPPLPQLPSPTPLEAMLARDRAAATTGGSVPDGALMLRLSRSSPWVQQLQAVAGGQCVPPVPAAIKQAPTAHAGTADAPNEQDGDGLAPLAAGPERGRRARGKENFCSRQYFQRGTKVFQQVTIPDLELPRGEPVEEKLRSEVVQLLWEDDMLRPSAWGDVDRWHNMNARYYNACQKLTWQEARARAPDHHEMSAEDREKLGAVRPASLAQAQRIPGVTPAVLLLLLQHVKRSLPRREQRGATGAQAAAATGGGAVQ